ncbi:beta-galactosidase [Diaminobutyricibacter tongyongensis]|uniref:Beta-galactosidase n=1 Tax=Leifsonia tongyongensis TaxID=1268043 RepID=A0A6L9XUH7_9MICO|nr:beta-galactosidase [Diaminobutyricibacter tongyongensis]
MIWFGGDYNPEQWEPATWGDDVRLMKEGGINLATVGVFAWSRIEPRDGEFDFEWLDEVIAALTDAGIAIDLATATASPPPWLTHAHPEMLPVTEDGVRLHPGSRQHYCPSSPIYRRYAARLVTAIARRYGDHPGLRLWHVNNEYGCHVGRCYCDVSAQAFREWLTKKYGTIERLNEAWGTTFWSQIYGSFEEIYPPRSAPTFRNPAQLLDFDRFSSNELLECFRVEVAILREICPGVPVTTNFLGFTKLVSYWDWASEVDIVSYDSYPEPDSPDSPARAAMSHDLMRSLGGGQPWLLMEQAASAVSWGHPNRPKSPGQMRAWSYQALAHGADGILYFQWRQSVFGAERFLTGMLPHSGDTSRVWAEVSQLGGELAALERVQGTRVHADVAIVVDWDSWWAIEQEALPAQLSYSDGIFSWYRELFELNVSVDFVRSDQDLSAYRLVVVPSLFVLTETAAATFDSYVQGGGHLFVTYQTGIVDESTRIAPGGYLGALQNTLGVSIEEFAPLVPSGTRGEGDGPRLGLTGPITGPADAELWSEYVHTHGAEVQASFSGGSLAGWPALTRNETGRGVAWYAATLPERSARAALLEHLLEEAGIPANRAVPGLEVVTRGDVVISINHGGGDVHTSSSGTDLLSGEPVAGVALPPFGVSIVVPDDSPAAQADELEPALTGRN